MTGRMLTYLLIFIACSVAAQHQQKWPNNKKAVIILTYDDALTSQLKVALPQLNRYRMRGTFFLDGRIPEDEVALWQAASNKGHELANHTLYHPCSAKAFKNHDRLYAENYDVISMLSEIRMMNKFLFMLDGKKERTYAYPCTETSVGGEEYTDSLRATGFVKYARVGGDENTVITDISTIDYMKVPSFAVAQNQDGAALINYVERVRQSGGIGILMFHGVGGDYIAISSEAHEKLLQYLSNHKQEIWVAPFREVMDYISQQAR